MWSMSAALQQVDDVAVDAGAQDVRAHHQDAGGAAALRGLPRRAATAARSGCSNGGVGVVERQPALQLQIVGALGERLDQQARAVEHVRYRVMVGNISIGSRARRGTGSWG